MSRKWYVVKTEPGLEHLAFQELRRDEFEVFAPRMQTPNKTGGREDIALFPGYLFLKLDLDDTGWPVFRPAHRIRGFIRFGRDLPTLSDEAVQDLSNRVKAINGEDGLWQRFKLGETVQVISGALEGLGLVLEEARSPQGRATVLMDFMGRQVQAEVPWRNLKPSGLGAVNPEQWERRHAPRRTRGKGRWIKGHAPQTAASP